MPDLRHSTNNKLKRERERERERENSNSYKIYFSGHQSQLQKAALIMETLKVNAKHRR